MKDVNKGLFISFEGLDGSGKSSVLEKIQSKVKNFFYNIDSIFVREPGDSEIGENIRTLLLNPNYKMSALTEAFLFAAARAELFNNINIKNHLKNNGLLISDRYIDSTIAYQGYGRGLSIDKLLEINKYATNGLMPKYTFFLMIEPQKAYERIWMNRMRKDRLDGEDLKFYNTIYEGYLNIIRENSLRAIVIDASKTLEDVVVSVWDKLKSIIKEYYKI